MMRATRDDKSNGGWGAGGKAKVQCLVGRMKEWDVLHGEGGGGCSW